MRGDYSMGMESVYRLSVVLGMNDGLTSNLSSVTSSVTDSAKKLNDAFGTVQKAGAALTGVGAGIIGAGLATVKSTFDTQDALGELSSLGVTDLKAVESAAKSFSDTWAGTTKSDFITAAYDIKSGIASLTDEGVAQFTELAALTGKATKSTTEEMGSLFATGYGIYKSSYEDMSDLEFGEMFSAGISTAVKNYKTAGSEMASSISALGASNEEGWLYEEGADIEDLEDLRTRAEDAWSELAERTTEEKLINVSKKVSGVLGVRVDAQHPRGQGTTDIIITSTSGEATQELLKKVENATAYLKGNYDDFLYKSSTIVNVDIKLTLYIAKDASTDGVQQTAEKTIEKFMQLSSREELNCLYMDDIRYALKSDIETYKRAEISSPDGDIELDKGKVIMLGGIEVIVKNVGGA